MTPVPSTSSSLLDNDRLTSRIGIVIPKVAEEVAEQESTEESA